MHNKAAHDLLVFTFCWNVVFASHMTFFFAHNQLKQRRKVVGERGQGEGDWQRHASHDMNGFYILLFLVTTTSRATIIFLCYEC